MVQIGPYEIRSVVTGTMRLDGGAMFGVVPKILWDKVSEVDDANRILLCTRSLLAVNRRDDRVFLVDTGCGTKWTPDKADRYAITYDEAAIPAALKEHGLSEGNITDVVVTHLHFDHNGGLTVWEDDPEGPTCLRYPQARHWIHRKHWEHANRPHFKDRASYLKEDFQALGDAGVLHFVEGEEPASPLADLAWVVTHGHTPYQLHPLFGNGSDRLLFVGDLVPTIAHLRLGWVMAYDMEPLRTIHEKETVYRRCFDEGLMIAFPHDPEHGGVAIGGTVDRPIVSQALPLD